MIVNFWNPTDIALGHYPDPADKIRYWQATDSLENFKLRTDNKYTETSIVYEHNSYGYRTKEFEFNSTTPSILCLGCSCTYGTGVVDPWVNYIEQQYPNYNVYNLGFPGCNSDTVARILLSIGDKLNTKIVCILWPGVHRFSLYNSNWIRNVLISNPHDQQFFLPDLLNYKDAHFNNLRYKNQAIVNLLADKYEYRIIENTIEWMGPILVDFGRDYHPGPETQKIIADYFISKIS